MKVLFLVTITTLTTLDLGELSYEQYCLRDQQEGNWDDTSQTPTTTPGVTTNKKDFPIRSRMDAQSVYASLVMGIEELRFIHRDELSRLKLTCEGPVPVAVNSLGQVLIAAAQYGNGRVVVMPHENYIKIWVTEPEFGRLVRNAIDWLKPHPDALVGVNSLTHLTDFLKEGGIKVTDVASYDRAVEVFCCDAYNIIQAEELLQFVKKGGGLLIAGQAWHWSYTNVLRNFPGNKVVSATGIVFSSEIAVKEVIKVPKEIPSTIDCQS